jgi:hypothetical protein
MRCREFIGLVSAACMSPDLTISDISPFQGTNAKPV